jgi:nitrite reductase/ring-hydroxylating ferredoxin subunit
MWCRPLFFLPRLRGRWPEGPEGGSLRPPAGTILCRLDDIAEPGAKGFVFGSGKERFEMFVVRARGGVFAYLNACPHLGATLDTFPDQFLTADKELIICSFHGAQFQIEDGLCVVGPCDRKHLTPIKVGVENGAVVVT